MENPYSTTHYLVKYFPIKATIIDKDRTEDGDYFKKPTQYWFVNCKPQSNLVWEPLLDTPSMTISDIHCASYFNRIDGVSREEKRSLIHPQYARRFILRYIGHSVLPLESNADQEQKMSLEKTKVIPGYEKYLVTTWGRVYNTETKQFLKPYSHYKGYLRVDLWNGGEKRHFKVHRLVADAFIPNPDNKPQVNHIDGNKHNNSITNLEWATNKENCDKARALLLQCDL